MSAATLHILEEARELPVLELDQLIAHLAALRAQKAAPSLPARQAELLEKINTIVPPALRERWVTLLELQQARDLSEPERTELLSLVDTIELKEAERAVLLSELAQVRGVSVLELVAQLGLRPRDQEPT